jgi:hypothetical protein
MIYLLLDHDKEYLIYYHEDNRQGYGASSLTGNSFWNKVPPQTITFVVAEEDSPEDWWEPQHDEYCDAQLVASFDTEDAYNNWAINNPEIYI